MKGKLTILLPILFVLLSSFVFAAPIAPTNFQARAVSINTINLTWNYNFGSEDRYYIYQSTDGTNFAYKTTVLFSAFAMSTLIGSLSPNTRYWYSIRSSDGFQNSTAVFAFPVYTLASTPTSVAAATLNKTSVFVSWNGDGNDYYVTATTGLTSKASGFVTGKNYTFTDLSCFACIQR